MEIIETCIKFHWFYDRKQWDELGLLLNDVVSMPTLEEVAAGFDADNYLVHYHRTRAEVTTGLRSFAEGLVTQHLVAGHQVTITGDTAFCIAHGINVHIRDADRTAPPLWHGNTGGGLELGRQQLPRRQCQTAHLARDARGGWREPGPRLVTSRESVSLRLH
jgi:hypothetical protein